MRRLRMRRLRDRPHHLPHRTPTGPEKAVGVVIGTIFGLIGLVVVGSLWLGGFGGMQPPLFFRLVGSLVALSFVVIGFGMAAAVLFGIYGRQEQQRSSEGGAGPTDTRQPGPGRADFACPRCGAALGNEADVSPHGDVKCSYCRQWFNIHGRRS